MLTKDFIRINVEVLKSNDGNCGSNDDCCPLGNTPAKHAELSANGSTGWSKQKPAGVTTCSVVEDVLGLQ